MVHAHEILSLVEMGYYNRRTLQKAVVEKFGRDAVYTNCTGHAYDFNSIFDFLVQRHKIATLDDGRLVTLVHNICS